MIQRDKFTQSKIDAAFEFGKEAQEENFDFGIVNNPRALAFVNTIEGRKARTVAIENYNRGYRS